jgi:hypothetical protein
MVGVEEEIKSVEMQQFLDTTVLRMLVIEKSETSVLRCG